MAQTVVHTNLARTWRSKTFGQMVGQDLAVRILQNSLFKNYFFPVYLFAGQRGCGKTTSARLFAAAVNCHRLSTFQKDPRSCSLPCLTCPSCLAMSHNNHPDFIEIDAASHTGVDNVRQIIDAASLMPVLGNKKVYLIDEAHMLSKAAFNAFLKILEEPPASVLFMLATTDPHKIIDTVRSRCFQLFFGPIPADDLQRHLIHVCQEEHIKADPQALYTIVHETEGSARDALNLLEQVRFAHTEVTQEAVLHVIGHLPEPAFFDLIESVIAQDPAALIELCNSLKLSQYAIPSLWKKIVMLLKGLLYSRYTTTAAGIQDQERLHALAQTVSPTWLAKALRHVYGYEQTLLKTTVQADMLELMLLELMNLEVISQGPAPVRQERKIPVQATSTPATTAPKTVTSVAKAPEEIKTPVAVAASSVPLTSADSRWTNFLQSITQLSDPLLLSIFRQADFVSCNEETKELELLFSKEATFFGQWLTQTKTVWDPLLHKAFGLAIVMHPRFEKENSVPKTVIPKRDTTVYVAPTASSTKQQTASQQNARPYEQKFNRKPATASSASLPPSVAIDIQDKEKWPKAHKLLEQFGGTVSELKGEKTYVE